MVHYLRALQMFLVGEDWSMQTFLAILGVIFLIYLLFRFFPVFAEFAGLVLGGVVIALITLGFIYIALPIVALALILVGGIWLFKKIRESI